MRLVADQKRAEAKTDTTERFYVAWSRETWDFSQFCTQFMGLQMKLCFWKMKNEVPYPSFPLSGGSGCVAATVCCRNFET